MLAVILVGGKGTRIKEFRNCPKPLIKVNKIEILKHIINIYLNNNINNFVLLCREDNLSEFIKFKNKNANLKISIINSKNSSNTGKRISFLKKIVKKNENFCLTYGDSLANFNYKKTLKIHLKNENMITLNLYKKKTSYGTIELKQKKVLNFSEKKREININAGFYIMNEKILKFCKKNLSLESDILPKLAKKNKLGYNTVDKWHPMDNKDDYYSIQKFLKKNFINF